MAVYSFLCKSCTHKFSVESSMAEYDKIEKSTKCPKCKKIAERDNSDFNSLSWIGPTKTLGSHADKNSDKMSADEKHHITKETTKYRDESSSRDGFLPEGATWGKDEV